MQLILGNRNYSSWSLRVWLALQLTGIECNEVVIPLFTPEHRKRIADYSPSGRVPVLIDHHQKIWDSLAITEFLAERFPTARLWPADPEKRNFSRSVAAEIHSGFQKLRTHYPMNLRRPPSPHPQGPDAADDIERVCEIWRWARGEYGGDGPYLFGPICAADCFFAPIVTRFVTYQLPVGPAEKAYCDSIMTHPLMQQWISAARREPWTIEEEEVDS